jgi:hypothetical protein
LAIQGIWASHKRQQWFCLLFAVAILALAVAGRATMAALFGALIVLNLALMIVLHQRATGSI